MVNNNGNNHIKIGELPDIRVVSARDLHFHEDPDEERLLGLVNRLGGESVLKNPPIVADCGNDSGFIILDGANRVTALLKLNFDHIPVQVVAINDPLLTIKSWNHAVEKLGRQFFMEKLSEMDGINIKEERLFESIEDSGYPINSKGYLCSFAFEDGSTISAFNNGELFDMVSKLKKITDLYLHKPLSDRVSYTNLAHLKHNYPEFRTLMTFRKFAKEELPEIVFAGEKLPAGITRVLLPKRALGLNIQLEFLKSSLTLDEKNHWLTEMIHRMVLSKSIRFYQEPTFVFDE